MSEEQNAGVAGGFGADLPKASYPAPGTGCCGSPAADANAGSGSTAAATTGEPCCGTAAEPCCGTAAEAKAEDSCCGSQAKAEAVASGTSCCG